MLTRILLVTTVLVLAVFLIGGAGVQTRNSYEPTKPEATQSPSPTDWPNLDKLRNPNGKMCGLGGASSGIAEKAAQNRLRNRYHLPENGFEQVTLDYLQTTLPQGEVGPQNILVNYPKSDDPNNGRAVALVAYVTDVMVLGCGAANEVVSYVPPPERRGVEAANCYVNKADLCTAQILVTSDPKLPRDNGRNVFFVNVTRRSRILARKNLLVSNVGNDWSTPELRTKLKDRWVRFSGWLFFNQNYRERAWIIDPENKIGKSNDRQSAWGLHPVMGIEVDVSPP